MKYFVIAFLSFLLGMLVQRHFFTPEPNEAEVDLILERSIQQVSKLVVTESHYSKLYSKKSSDAYLFDLIHFDKKALVLGEVEADLSYDLKQLEYEADASKKVIRIERTPPPQIDYHYDFQWYDIEQSSMNKFAREDLNKIQKDAKADLKKQIDQDSLAYRGHERLIEELHQIWSGMEALGWTIEDESKVVKASDM